MHACTLRISRVGQIDDAQVSFGDLTVLVGPQATGKSIFLEFLKLLTDTGPILAYLKSYGLQWRKDVRQFLKVYLGEGMESIWRPESSVFLNGQQVDLGELISRVRKRPEAMFYIPAQRVLTLREGWPRPFSDYGAGDPFTVRDFSEKLRLLMETGFGAEPALFPRTRRLKNELRDLLDATVFSGFKLSVDTHGAQKRLVLGSSETESSLPFMVWSAGQREFVPLLLGLYWLLPPTKVSRRAKLEWVVIEELEMGLHPRAISAVLLIVLELLSRGYRVCISTHSPHVLDLVWAIKVFQRHRAGSEKLLQLFDVRPTVGMKEMAGAAIRKTANVYYFDPATHKTADISDLDPGAPDAAQARWGGLTEFSGRVADVVADVVAGHKELGPRRKAKARVAPDDGQKRLSFPEAPVGQSHT